MAFLVRQEQEKKHLRILQKYAKHFKVEAPYKVIVGPYFAQTVADRHVSLVDNISQLLLHRDCHIYTTRCCINELQDLADKGTKKFVRGAHILRTLKLLPCKHNISKSKNKDKNKNQNENQTKNEKSESKHGWNCVDPKICLSSYMNFNSEDSPLKLAQKAKNDKKSKKKKKKNMNSKIDVYLFAMQPKSYLSKARSQPGIPTIWMYQANMVLDRLSDASLKEIELRKLAQQEISKKLLQNSQQLDKLADKMETIESGNNNNNNDTNNNKNNKNDINSQKNENDKKEDSDILAFLETATKENGGNIEMNEYSSDLDLDDMTMDQLDNAINSAFNKKARKMIEKTKENEDTKMENENEMANNNKKEKLTRDHPIRIKQTIDQIENESKRLFEKLEILKETKQYMLSKDDHYLSLLGNNTKKKKNKNTNKNNKNGNENKKNNSNENNKRNKKRGASIINENENENENEDGDTSEPPKKRRRRTKKSKNELTETKGENDDNSKDENEEKSKQSKYEDKLGVDFHGKDSMQILDEASRQIKHEFQTDPHNYQPMPSFKRKHKNEIDKSKNGQNKKKESKSNQESKKDKMAKQTQLYLVEKEDQKEQKEKKEKKKKSKAAKPNLKADDALHNWFNF